MYTYTSVCMYVRRRARKREQREGGNWLGISPRQTYIRLLIKTPPPNSFSVSFRSRVNKEQSRIKRNGERGKFPRALRRRPRSRFHFVPATPFSLVPRRYYEREDGKPREFRITSCRELASKNQSKVSPSLSLSLSLKTSLLRTRRNYLIIDFNRSCDRIYIPLIFYFLYKPRI